MKKKNKLPVNITVRFSHLNPVLQDIITKKKPFFLLKENDSLIPARHRKSLAKAGVLLNISALSLHSPAELKLGNLSASASSGHVYSLSRKQMIQAHQKLIDSIKQYGLVQTKFEGNYPKDWINPTIVSKTHPSFHVKGNGDIVFHKTTRREYFRVKFQNRFKLGLWKWRACLTPPVAPKKVRDWAKAKLNKIVERTKEFAPRPMPQPVPLSRKREKRRKLKPKFA